jgi:hypothetical protein
MQLPVCFVRGSKHAEAGAVHQYVAVDADIREFIFYLLSGVLAGKVNGEGVGFYGDAAELREEVIEGFCERPRSTMTELSRAATRASSRPIPDEAPVTIMPGFIELVPAGLGWVFTAPGSRPAALRCPC